MWCFLLHYLANEGILAAVFFFVFLNAAVAIGNSICSAFPFFPLVHRITQFAQFTKCEREPWNVEKHRGNAKTLHI